MMSVSVMTTHLFRSLSNSVHSWFMTYHIFNMSNTTGITSGVGTDYHSGAHELTPLPVAQYLIFCIVFCISLYCLSFSLFLCHCIVCLFPLPIVLSVFFYFPLPIVLSCLLRFIASDNPFGVFKLLF